MDSPDVRRLPRTSYARPILRWCWIGLLCFAVFVWISLCVMPDITMSVDEHGFVYEPYFWIIPIAWLCAFCGCVLGLVDLLIGLFRSLGFSHRRSGTDSSR